MTGSTAYLVACQAAYCLLASGLLADSTVVYYYSLAILRSIIRIDFIS